MSSSQAVSRREGYPGPPSITVGEHKHGILISCTLSKYHKLRRVNMGDKGGRKGKEKSQKQKTEKHIHDVQAQKDKQQKSPFDIKSR